MEITNHMHLVTGNYGTYEPNFTDAMLRVQIYGSGKKILDSCVWLLERINWKLLDRP